jgi:hypothetical protein
MQRPASYQRALQKIVKKVVDEKRETLHNLTSSLLTNTTLCRRAASSKKDRFFNN